MRASAILLLMIGDKTPCRHNFCPEHRKPTLTPLPPPKKKKSLEIVPALGRPAGTEIEAAGRGGELAVSILEQGAGSEGITSVRHRATSFACNDEHEKPVWRNSTPDGPGFRHVSLSIGGQTRCRRIVPRACPPPVIDSLSRTGYWQDLCRAGGPYCAGKERAWHPALLCMHPPAGWPGAGFFKARDAVLSGPAGGGGRHGRTPRAAKAWNAYYRL